MSQTLDEARSAPAQENPAFLLPRGTVLKSGEHLYQLGAVIGQGGFGVTYLGQDGTSGRRVAIKEYFPTRCSRRADDGRTVEPLPGMEQTYEDGRYSFVKEARVLSGLEGTPSVVQALAYLETNNTAYLVMEYLDGTPLHRMVDPKTGKRIPPEKLLPPLKKLLYDIGQLHEKNVIHRDIAPDNIMWMPDGTLKLLDFGSARSMEDGKSMTVMLKHGFAPVEQYQRHGQGTYTDVYAMAATIYYCLTATVPPQSTERLLGGESVRLQRPTALGAALAPEEENALLWGLEVLPQARPQTMGEFARRLFPELSAAAQPISEPSPAPSPNPSPAQKPTLFSRYMARIEKGRAKAEARGSRWEVWVYDHFIQIIIIGVALFILWMAMSLATGWGTADTPSSGHTSPPAVPALSASAIPSAIPSIIPSAGVPDVVAKPMQEPGRPDTEFPLSMEIGPDSSYALVELYTADDGAVYGLTDAENAVLLRVPDGVSSYTVPNYVGEDSYYVIWIEAGALDNATEEITVNLSYVTCFDFSLYDRAEWVAPANDSLSRNWVLNCRAARAANVIRGGGQRTVIPSFDMMFAADDRALELTELFDGETRPNGSTEIFALLEVYGCYYTQAQACWAGMYDSYSEIEAEIMSYVPGWAAPADENGRYWDALGLSVVKGDDGQYYFWCYAMYQ